MENATWKSNNYITTYTLYHFNNFVILSNIYFPLFNIFFILNDIYI